MCGITIYKGNPVEVSRIWDSMLEIKHRGSEDGFGFVNLSNKDVVRSILTLEEIHDNKIDETRKVKKNTLVALKKRLIDIQVELKKETDFFALHNRKASCGNVELLNTHPFKMNKGVYYMHNGSVDGADILKQFMKIECGTKFITDTDSEFLAWYVESKLADNYTEDQIFIMLDKLCQYGFGVLVRVDLIKNEITIFKDSDRTLYAYIKNDSILIMSEPIATITEFVKCYRLEKGIIKLNNKLDISKCKVTDITAKLNEVLTKETNEYSCDYCKTKAKTKRLWDMKDYCLVCSTSGIDLKAYEKAKDTTLKCAANLCATIKDDGSFVDEALLDSDGYGKHTDAGNPIFQRNWKDNYNF